MLHWFADLPRCRSAVHKQVVTEAKTLTCNASSVGEPFASALSRATSDLENILKEPQNSAFSHQRPEQICMLQPT
jgi:hypothetical protein